MHLNNTYKDPSMPIDQRVEDLLSKMTIDEKIAQMYSVWADKRTLLCNEAGEFDFDMASKHFPDSIGQFARPSEVHKNGYASGRNAEETAIFTNKVQRFFIERTRLGIPVIFHEECLHGYMAKGGTSFPTPIALASSWDTALIRQIFDEIAEEVRARGGHYVLTPVVDIVRDPRWGRFDEAFSEDPFLTAECGIAAVQGLQGCSGPDAPIDMKHVGATLKHFAGHGHPESGMNTAPANFPLRSLYETVLEPFRQCINRAFPSAIMASYNEIDGVPSHANRWLLEDILRKQWGFKGFVVADYCGIQQLYERHFVADGPESAAQAAVQAGVDIEYPDRLCYPHIKNLVQKGKLLIDFVDNSVRRLLMLKFRLGLFDNPYVDVARAVAVTGSEQKRELACKAAEKSAILLKNENSVLPLDMTKYKRIGVIGPNADKVLLGPYSEIPLSSVSLLEGIRERVQDEQCTVVYSEGCRITEAGKWTDDEVKLPDPQEEKRRLAEAYELASTCDCIILALGGNELVCREAWVEWHLGDSTTLDLIGNQNELFPLMCKTGKPIIVTLFHGRPQSITQIAEKADAILDCWYLGQEAGRAVAKILFGDCNPGGKLTVSVPRSVGHIPAFYNYKPTARRGYLFDDVTPLFPFGFGLSYTTFSISNPVLSHSEMRLGQSVTVSVDVRNTGRVAGDEVVQMYIRDCVSSVTRPVKELKGFRRVSLKPGESVRVDFAILSEMLAFYNREMQFITEPGAFEIMIGNSSRDCDLKKITLKVVSA